MALVADELVFKAHFERGGPLHLFVALVGVALMSRCILATFANPRDLSPVWARWDLDVRGRATTSQGF